MTREQVKAIVQSDDLTDQIMPSIERALALGYQPQVWLNKKGQIVIEVSTVLSEGSDADDEEERD